MCSFPPQEEGFEEDEAIYDELNLDEEETALGLGGDGTSSDDDGDDASEGQGHDDRLPQVR